MNKINLGVFSELANNKADRDLRNVDLNKTDIIIEYQEPTAENDYTWYRLYASGWCEQGGISGWKVTITLPIKMQDTNYCVQITGNMTSSSTLGYPVDAINKTVSDFYLGTRDTGTQEVAWQVSGKANMAGHEIIPSKAEQEEFEHRVIEFQKPTSENNYTWYRKYADGWVEQGGVITGSTSGYVTVNLPITMSNTKYTITQSAEDADEDANVQITGYTHKTVNSFKTVNSYTSFLEYEMSWQVSGMYVTEE